MLPIIAMTAHVMRGDRERCLSAGMNDYPSKPIDSHQLIRLVEKTASCIQNTVNPEAMTHLNQPNGDEFQHPSMCRIIDIPSSLRRMGGDVSLLKEMASFFLNDGPELLRSIESAAACEEVSRAAHSLRGLASNFGASAIVELTSQIESSGSTPSQRGRAIAELRTAMPQFLAELRELVESA